MSAPRAMLATYTTQDGFEFSLVHFTPEKKASHDVVIYIHGNGSAHALKNVHQVNAMAARLAKDDIDFIIANNRGSNYIEQHKQKKGDLETKVFTGMAYERISDSQYDIDGILQYAVDRRYRSIYLLGVSTGANKIAIYDKYAIAKPEELKGYIFASGGDDVGLRRRLLGDKLNDSLGIIRKYVEEGRSEELVDSCIYPTRHPLSYGSLLEMLEESSDYNVFNYHTAVAGKTAFEILRQIKYPSLFIYGSNDDTTYVSVNAAVDLLKKELSKKSNSFLVVEGADHNFRDYNDAFVDEIVHWILRVDANEIVH